MSTYTTQDTRREAAVITTSHGYPISGRQRRPHASPEPNRPLVIAIHGGTYTSAYFDIPGYSLMDRAERLGIPIIALDRPGYGTSTAFASAESTIRRSAEILDTAIGQIVREADPAANGVVLIGHSIGGAVAVAIAARQPAWPLVGLAVSGGGLNPTPESRPQWAALPEVPAIELPTALKDEVMFGPAGTFDADVMPVASHVADAPAPRAELIDIVFEWSGFVHELAAAVTVPVHYRQAESDRLWIVDAEEVRGFGAAFKHAGFVSAELYPHAGHCIDFHHAAEAFQTEQLAFALRCAVTPLTPR